MKPDVTVEQFQSLTGIPVQRIINQFKMTIRPEVASGKETPTWQDFDSMKNFVWTLKELKQDLASKPETAHLLESVGAELKLALTNDAIFQNLFAMQKEVKAAGKTVYQPNERELKRAYQFYILELNKVLPRELRIPVARLPFDNRVATLNTEAKDYMKGVEKRYEEMLSTSSIESYEKFVEKLRQSEDPEVKMAIKLIEREKLQVVMRRPTNARFWVPKVGFQNQFITNSSRGSLSPEWRNLAERNLYDQQDLETYTARDPEFKPKYGTLSLKPRTSALKPDLSWSAQYGSDIYGFKTEAIQDRLTFYPADSLGPGMNVAAATNKNWDASLIPWKYRMLMVPHMVENLKGRIFNVSSDTLNLLPGNSVIYAHRYWETQILGAVRLQDVDTFTFTENNPPKGEFLRALIQHNIKIYDGSAGLGPKELKKWTPTPEQLAEP